MNVRIQKALEEYDIDPISGADMLRALRDENPVAYRLAAFGALFEPEPRAGHKDMVRFVREKGGDLLPMLFEKPLDLDRALLGVKTLCRAERGADVRLIRLLTHPKIAEDSNAVSRLLDILEQLPSIPQMVPILMQVYSQTPKQVRARIATMIGREHQNQEWVEQRLSDPDSRVRANIVELYIGHHSLLAVEVFRRGIVDTAPRVVANAALGMYFAGSAPTLHFLGTQMASSASANERAAAAWAMGQSRDPRFRCILSRLVRDADPMVRRQSIRGLAILRRADENPATGDNGEPEGPVVVEGALQFRAPDGQVLYQLQLRRMPVDEEGPTADAHAQLLTGVRPIEVITYEHSAPVLDYELKELDGVRSPGIYELTYQSQFPLTDTRPVFAYRRHCYDYKPA